MKRNRPLKSSRDCERTNRRFTSKAVISIASPVVGLITSFQEQMEWHLRIASLLVGLTVCIMSLVAMTRKIRRR